MRMDREFIKPLANIANSLDVFLKTPNQKTFERLNTEVNKMMDTLFMYHGRPENHENPNVFMDSLLSGGRRQNTDFPEVLRNIIIKNEDGTFLGLAPFSQELLRLYDLLGTGISLKDIFLVEPISLIFKGYIAEAGIVETLLEMREYAKAAAGLQVDTSVSYNMQTLARRPDKPLGLARLSAGISKEITPRMQSQPPYNLINWKLLQLLGNKVLEISDHGQMIKNHINNLRGDFVTLANYLDSLVLYERSKYDPSIPSPSFAAAPNLDQITNLAVPIIGNSLNLETSLLYLGHIDSFIAVDSEMNRMAILRVICVLGEVSKNLSEDLLSIDNNLFTFLRDMRDMIIHADEYLSIQDNINSLIHNLHDQRLFRFASQDLPIIQQFFAALSQSVLQGIVSPGLISDRLGNISALHLSLTKEYKLTLEQKNELTSMLPAQDIIEVSDKRKVVADILQGNAILPQTYKDFAPLVEGLGLSTGKTKDLFVKLTQSRLCDAVIQAIIGGADNNSLKNLVIKLQSKEQIKQDILTSPAIELPELQRFIALHKEKVRLTDQEIQALLQKIPVDVMDIRHDKAVLRDMIVREQLPSQHDLQRHLDKIGLNQAQKAQFMEAADILMNKKPSLYDVAKTSHNAPTHAYSAVISDIEKVEKAITVLRGLTHNLRLLPEAERFEAFLLQHNLVYACEFAFNIFVDHARILDSLIDQVRDYQDLMVRSIFLTDPYTELQQELKGYVISRNDIFHLETIYSGFGGEYVERSKLYNMVTHRVEGILFPNAIVIAQNSIKEEPVRATSLYSKLQAVSDQLIIKLAVDSHLQEVNLGIKDRLFYIKNFGKVGFFFGKELQEIQKIMHKYDVQILIENESSLNRAYKALSLKIHPDKVVNTQYDQEVAIQDYKYVNHYKSVLTGDLSYRESVFLTNLMLKVHQITHYTAVGIKLCDITVDILRVANKPELNTEVTWKLGSDTLQLYNLYYGFDKYSLGVRLAEIGYMIHNEEYKEALSTAISTISFAAIPTIMSIINPWVGLVYGITITGYSVYSLYNNIYALYEEYSVESIKIEGEKTNNDAPLCMVPEMFYDQNIGSKCYIFTEWTEENTFTQVPYKDDLDLLI